MGGADDVHTGNNIHNQLTSTMIEIITKTFTKLGTICIELWANSWYCAEYTGIGVASALEYKDFLYGHKWDWLDWLCPVAGATIGYAARYIISTNIQ